MTFISRAFHGRPRDQGQADRLPLGQYRVRDFPVLSAGPTPRTPLTDWTFSITGEVDKLKNWTWDEFRKLASETITRDIHCVTKWSKLDTVWEGVSIDTLLDGVDTSAEYVMAFSDGGYTTNLPLEDLLSERALLADRHHGAPLPVDHGGPVRLVVPHLYAWKSAKWVNGLELRRDDQRGFWERAGYHVYGDPWREERFSSQETREAYQVRRRAKELGLVPGEGEGEGEG